MSKNQSTGSYLRGFPIIMCVIIKGYCFILPQPGIYGHICGRKNSTFPDLEMEIRKTSAMVLGY